MMNPHDEKRIALAFPIGLAFLDRLFSGIASYAQRRGGWSFTSAPEAINASIRWLRDWSGDGAFVLVLTPADAHLARRLRIPVVNLASWLPSSGVPTVSVDHEEVGRLAARYLLGKHFVRLGYYGTDGLWFSELRRRGFEGVVRDAGKHCSTLLVQHPADPDPRWTDQQEEIQLWLKAQRPPVGIMASTDLRARMVVEACGPLGLRVPDDVAVLGVDNDPIACEFSKPPLSSISRNDQEVGYRAAALLDHLMGGGAPPDGPVYIAPDGVVQRGSTETLAVENPHVAAAVRYIFTHCGECFGVKQLLGQVGLSRRRLEHYFHEQLGCTPRHFIDQVRVARAKELLADPSRLTYTAIADATGFNDIRRFRLVFRRLEGLTPAEYRQSLSEEGLVKPGSLTPGD
jgi:LacI family transcriptional regulator